MRLAETFTRSGGIMRLTIDPQAKEGLIEFTFAADLEGSRGVGPVQSYDGSTFICVTVG